MTRSSFLFPIALALAFAAAPAHAGGGDLSGGADLSDLADLEALSRLVERDGLKELKFEAFEPGLPKGLTFTPPGDAAYRAQWKEAYVALAKEMFAKLRGIVGTEPLQEGEKMQHAFKRLTKALKKARKKDEAAKEGLQVLQIALPRINELIERIFGDEDPALMDKRAQFLETFNKRFELGKTQSVVTPLGTDGVDVKVAQEKWEFVVGEVGAWRYKPLKGADGEQVTIGGLKVEWGKQLRTGKLRQSLRDLSYLESYKLSFHQVGRIQADGSHGQTGQRIEIVGARLLFGFYYFIRYDDKLVVVREPKPVSKPGGK